jgi:MFS family permease
MINYYAPVIFQDNMGLSRNLSLILGGAAQCTYLVGSAIPVFLVDRFGRRALLITCSMGLCLCFLMVTILLSLGTVRPAYGATTFIFIFQLVYGIGWLPVPWFYPSEVNTTRVRARMQAIASGWNWMAVFGVVKITPIAFGTSAHSILAGGHADEEKQTSNGGLSSSSLCSTSRSYPWCTASILRPRGWNWRMSRYCLQKVVSRVVCSAQGARPCCLVSMRGRGLWRVRWKGRFKRSRSVFSLVCSHIMPILTVNCHPKTET